MPSPINLTDYVREAFDGVVCDELDPMNYFGSDAIRDQQQADAVRVIEDELAARFGRGLTDNERVRITIDVAVEWQRRKLIEGERAYDFQEGKLWRHVDMKTYDRMN
jgi:hypothetical protein